MEFSTLAKYFELISQNSSRIEITKILAELFNLATANEAKIISYLSLGTLRAPYQGTQFNFAEKSIVKVLATILKTDAESCKAAIKQIGDVGACLMQSDWPYTDEHLSLEEIYNQLVTLEEISGTGSQEEKSQFLINILSKTDALSASYIVRMIIGTMRLGFSDMTLIDALSWMITGNKTLHDAIENGYNVCADIGLVAQKLKQEGIESVEAMQPIIGIPIRPAAAERLPSAKAIIEKLGPCIAQPKLDGFRLQIHVDKRDGQIKIWFYSRNLQDMSFMFPDLVAELSKLPVTTLITEGEAIVYDEQTGTFLPFQETVKRKRKHNIEEAAASLPLKLFLFDLLYLDGNSQLSFPYYERRENLKQIFANYSGSGIEVIGEQLFDNAKDLGDYFDEQITQGLEGIVVKRPDSPYKPGKRNFNWIKFKRHEEGHLDDTIDAVVLGYYAGRGKRANFGIGAFLVGVYNQKTDTYETIAKVGTGLKDADWIDLKSRCDAIKVAEQPHNVKCAPELKPDVWVNPQIVVIILADEITQSPLHYASRTDTELGLALRFPRFMGYSIDKLSTQATTNVEIKELYQMQFSEKKEEQTKNI